VAKGPAQPGAALGLAADPMRRVPVHKRRAWCTAFESLAYSCRAGKRDPRVFTNWNNNTSRFILFLSIQQVVSAAKERDRFPSLSFPAVVYPGFGFCSSLLALFAVVCLCEDPGEILSAALRNR